MAIIRLLLAVILTTTLLAIALPAVDTTRDHVGTATARDELNTLKTAITTLTTNNEPTASDLPTARRSLTLTVPDGTPGSTPVAWIAIGAQPNTTTADGPARDILAYRLTTGPVHTIHLDVDLRISINGTLQDDTTPLIITETTRITMTYTIKNGHPVIVLRSIRL